MRGLKLWLFTFALMLACLAAQGASYWVATNGNDSADGSFATPWLTIAKGHTTAGAGDTVYVLPGTYAERVDITTGGTAGNYKTLKGTNGTEIGPGGNVGFNLRAPYLHIEGFTLRCGTNVTGGNGHVHIRNSASYLRFLNNYITDAPDIGNQMIYVKEGAPMSLGSATNILIAFNTFSNWQYTCMVMNGTSNMVSSNLFINAGPATNGHQNDAIVFFGRDHVFRGNTFGGVDEVDPAHTDIFQTYGNVSGGVFTSNVLFEANIVTNSTTQIMQFSRDLIYPTNYVGHIIIRSNIYSDVGFGSTVYMSDLTVEWNTFYKVGRSQSAGGSHPFSINYEVTGARQAGAASNQVWRNNLYVDLGSDTSLPQFGHYVLATEITNSWTGNYNLVIGTGGGTTKTNFAIYGREANSINGSDPVFVNAAANDFRLAAGSPAIGAASDGGDIGAIAYSSGGYTPTIVTNNASGARVMGFRGLGMRP